MGGIGEQNGMIPICAVYVLSSRQLGEGSVVYFALYDWFDVDDRGAVDGFE